MARPTTDHDALFARLAVHNGLIEQTHLAEASCARSGDPSRTLAEHLVALGHLTDGQRSLLDGLATLHVEVHGDVEKSLAAVPADSLTRAGLARLDDPDIGATLDHATSIPEAPKYGDASPAPGHTVDSDTSGGEHERFRVLRPHARGGLGAVYVALDAELNREVALKQILDKHADNPISRQRFLLEAEVTGGLEHPGIVPVYGLGTYSDGRPYYAMRFIRGDTLKEAIDRFQAGDVGWVERSEAHRKTSQNASQPVGLEGSARLTRDPGQRSLELRKLLRRLIDVCNAIDYAHSRGVLHRDIKPGNIIVGKHGETLVVDWGLAKATGKCEPGGEEHILAPSSASGSSETLPGSTLGTPSYMSPEQARGDLNSLGAWSDVYSLGATLYCLLTGKPPLEGGEIDALLRKVQRGEFRRPRQLDPSIDTALEAICLKAMALKPEDRYATTRLLAEDIERWMADEPVLAYREPWTRTLTRWLSRHRTGVTAAGAAMLVALVGTAAVLAVQAVDNAQLSASLHRETRTNAALAKANEELSRSRTAVQARYELAVNAIKTFHTGVSEDFLLKQAQFKELRERLLKSASDFYGKLGALLGKETDDGSRRALAQSNFELAGLTSKVGHMENALAAHRAVLAVRQALAFEPGADVAASADVARSLTEIASLLAATGKTAEAVTTYRQAEALLSGPAISASAAERVRAALADCRSRLGYLLFTTGQTGDGLLVLRQARSDQEMLAEAPGSTMEARRELANTINRIGVLLHRTGRSSEAEAEYRKALMIYQELAADNPASTEIRRRLGFIHNNLGSLLLNVAGRPSGAEAEFRKAMEIKKKLADDNPAVTEFRSDVALSHRNLGEALNQMGRRPESEVEYRRAMAAYQKLTEDNPAVADFRSSLADARSSLAYLMHQMGRSPESESEFSLALAIRQKLADDSPAVSDFQSALARSRHNLGYLLAESGKPSQAEPEYRKAIAIYRNLTEREPTVTGFRDEMANSHLDLGLLLAETGRSADAEAEQRQAITLYQKLTDGNPNTPSYRVGLAGALYYLGDVIRTLGRPGEARESYDRAIAIQEKLVKDNPSPWYRGLLAHSLRRRGLALRDLRDPTGAAAGTRQALGLYDGLRSRSGEEWFETACCHAALEGQAGQAGSGVPAAEGEDHASEAISLLRKAAGAGYRNASALRIESALDPLRDRPDFRLLVMDLAFPAEPFAQRR